METTIYVFKPEGTIWRTFTNPSTHNYDEHGRLHITAQPSDGGGTVTTSLPYFIEQHPR